MQIVSFAFADFYPRPPRGGRPNAELDLAKKIEISTHALREEGDANRKRPLLKYLAFLPTPSARRATAINRNMIGVSVISTHALREEGD